MQPHDNDQRPSEEHSDRRRNPEQRALQSAIQLALSQVLNVAYGPVHIAEPGKPCNMGACVTGKGGLSA